MGAKATIRKKNKTDLKRQRAEPLIHQVPSQRVSRSSPIAMPNFITAEDLFLNHARNP
ncbi:hypothetical protein YC2023_011835 [Brassica napus]